MTELFNKLISKTLSNNPQDSDWHLMTLFSLAIQTKSKNILELGVRDGDTTEPLIMAANILEGKVTCIDIQNTQWTCPDEFKNNYEFIKIDAIEFLGKEVEKNSYYDLILVDDWHSYEHVKKEIELIDKITDNRSLILLHDLMGAGNAPNYFQPNSWGGEWANGGPFRAVNELDLNKWEWMTIPVNHGLTLLRKKSNINIY
jgi:predicted O-methyltransferase YrrM